MSIHSIPLLLSTGNEGIVFLSVVGCPFGSVGFLFLPLSHFLLFLGILDAPPATAHSLKFRECIEILRRVVTLPAS